VKLLFDQNLSPRLVPRLSDLYPASSHVSAVGLGEADDAAVWEYAKDHGFAIVTKDSDFNDVSVLRGFPPKRGVATARQLHDKRRGTRDSQSPSRDC
jgi:predicted nuclease of predicted toxin-antitoxin system